MELQTLLLKNITRGRLFFAPLNRYVESMRTVDVLEMCEGNSASAASVVAPYRDNPNWQLFELHKGDFPVPEGEISNAAAPIVVDAASDAPPAPQEAAPVGKKKHKIKGRHASLDDAGFEGAK